MNNGWQWCEKKGECQKVAVNFTLVEWIEPLSKNQGSRLWFKSGNSIVVLDDISQLVQSACQNIDVNSIQYTP